MGDMMNYRQRMRNLREDRDLSQADVGKLLNKSQQGYSHIENGRAELRIEDLIVLCRFYQVSADYFIGMTDECISGQSIRGRKTCCLFTDRPIPVGLFTSSKARTFPALASLCRIDYNINHHAAMPSPLRAAAVDKESIMPSISQRKTYIEFLRIIAAFLVIVNHTNSRIFQSVPMSKTWLVSITAFFTSKIAVPVFLMIMGALLLSKQDTPKKSIQRIVRIALAALLFSVPYYIYQHRTAPGDMRISDFFRTLYTWNITNAFWYLYMYLGLLCLLPLLQRMAAAFSKRDIELLLLLSLGVAGALPLTRIFFRTEASPHYTAALFSPYIGMVFAGHYLERYVPATRKNGLRALCLLLVLLAFQVFATRSFYDANPKGYLKLDDRTLITITLSAACAYAAARSLFAAIRLHERACRIIHALGSLTFGIYLLSDLIRVLSVPLFDALAAHTHDLLAMVLWEIFIFVVAAALTAVLKRIPGIRKLL